MAGSLTIVGMGIQVGSHLTLAAEAWIRQAEKVVFMVTDPVMAEWIIQLNATAEPLPARATDGPRHLMYESMVARITELVQQGHRVCAVYYGHPGVGAYSANTALRRIRNMGFEAQMTPAISADACLYADLGVDPVITGCQSYDATDFLIRSRPFDPHAALILWQVALIGHIGTYNGPNRVGLRLLQERLLSKYGELHHVVIYEASLYPTFPSVSRNVPLTDLSSSTYCEWSTLYVPPLPPGPPDLNLMKKLGMTLEAGET